MLYAIPDIAITGNVFFIDTRDNAVTASIPPNIAMLEVGGYHDPADGGEGAIYKRVDAAPTHPLYFTNTQDGQIWELVNLSITAEMGGCVRGVPTTNNTPIFNNIMKYFYTRGSGHLTLLDGDYYCKVQTLAYIPSYVTIEGTSQKARIYVNVSGLAGAGGYTVFITGNPYTSTRAGTLTNIVQQNIGTLDLSTVVYGIDARNFSIYCEPFVGNLPSNVWVHGIEFAYVYGLNVNNLHVDNMPNNGIYTIGGNDIKISGCTVQNCGFNSVIPAPRNGISCLGAVITNDINYTSKNLIISNNSSLYNKDEGIMVATFNGVNISDNICIGNTDRGIEGDSSFSKTATTASVGQVLPSKVVISNNYIDGLLKDGVSLAVFGITWNCDNQNHVIINDNYIANTQQISLSGAVQGGAIAVGQVDNGKVEVLGNSINNVTVGQNFSLINITAEYISIADNIITGCAANTSNNSTGISVAGKSIFIRDNNLIDSLTMNNFIRCTGHATLGCNEITVQDNVTNGVKQSFTVIAFNGAVANGINVINNSGYNLNSAGGNDSFVRFTSTTTTPSLNVSNNITTIAGTTTYPVLTDTLAVGSITNGMVKNNNWGVAYTVPSGARSISAATALVNRNENNNNIQTQRVSYTNGVAPTTGDWFVGDRVFNQAPAETGAGGSKYVVMGWICTVAGTPGTWLQMRTLTGN